MAIKDYLLIILRTNLVTRILIGILLAVLLAYIAPDWALKAGFLGELFIKSLKSVAPFLVFILIVTSIANQQHYVGKNIRFILLLYLVGTFLAALVAVVMIFMFPVSLPLNDSNIEVVTVVDQNVFTVLKNLILEMFDNPFVALMKGNFISILLWAILIGVALKQAKPMTKEVLQDIADASSKVVSYIISFAPLGIFGILAFTLVDQGFASIQLYLKLVILLLATMLFVALIVNPLIVALVSRKNPYPLVFKVLRSSGLTAFFTRSSVANIPVNLKLCQELELDEEIYSVTIPLGATINMAGAAITITILTLATVFTLNLPISFFSALLLCIIASLCAAGSSGIAGGSIMLIPVACSLFAIPGDVAAIVMGIGFTIGVLQDSMETALNSSTDVIFTALGSKEIK